MTKFAKLALIAITLCFAVATTATAQTWVAIAAGDEKGTGSGKGATSSAAKNEARSACRKSAGKKCDGWVASKSDPFLVVIRCKVSKTRYAAAGGYSKISVKDARQKAEDSLKKEFSPHGYNISECVVPISYRNGKFIKG